MMQWCSRVGAQWWCSAVRCAGVQYNTYNKRQVLCRQGRAGSKVADAVPLLNAAGGGPKVQSNARACAGKKSVCRRIS